MLRTIAIALAIAAGTACACIGVGSTMFKSASLAKSPELSPRLVKSCKVRPFGQAFRLRLGQLGHGEEVRGTDVVPNVLLEQSIPVHFSSFNKKTARW